MIWKFQSMVAYRFTLFLPAPELPQSIPGSSMYPPGGDGNREGKGGVLLDNLEYTQQNYSILIAREQYN